MQLYFALLFNANAKGFTSGNIYKGSTKQFCVPGLNCYSCPGAIGACPLGSLQGAFSADRSTLYYVCGILLLFGVLLGRVICGWLCPFGLIQELLHKIKTPKLRKSPVTRLLSWLKYVILIFFVFLVPIMYAFRDTPLPSFCKYICPAGTLEGGLGLLSNKVNASYFSMLGPLFTWKFLLLVAIVVGSIFVFRLFCRFLCPLGALYGFFNRISIFGIRLDRSACVDCGACLDRCKMDIRTVGDHECIDCGECIEVCPTHAISWKGSQFFLPKNEISSENSPSNGMTKSKRTVTRVISAILLAALLVGAYVYYWNSTTTAQPGCEVGDLCYGYDLQIIDGSGILEDTVNPADQSGKITIINFWGVWCTPCVNELPYFDRIAAEYSDEVIVIAVHTDLLSANAPAYIAEHYPNSQIIFAKDYAIDSDNPYAGGYYSSLGGRDMYPYTVILDQNGIIDSLFISSVEYEELKEAVDSLLN